MRSHPDTMDEAGIARIERELGIQLPRNYAEALIAYPFPEESSTAATLLWNDPRLLIDGNKRAHSIIQGANSKVIQRGQLFQIGYDGGEQAYFIDLKQPGSPIYVYDFELRSITEVCAGLESWLLLCRNSEAEIRADEERLARMAANKRWWQLWK